MAVATKRVKMHASRKRLSQDLLRELGIRRRLKFVPKWEGPVKGWAVNFVKRNAWRTMPHMEMDDLLQEAFMMFLHVKDKYPEVISPSHFMRLYQCCLSNFVTDMGMARTRRQQNELKAAEMELDRKGRTYEEEGISDVDVKLMLEAAPKEVQQLVETMRSKADEPYRRVNGRRETTGDRIARITGLDPAVDWSGIVCNWIQGAQWPIART